MAAYTIEDCCAVRAAALDVAVVFCAGIITTCGAGFAHGAVGFVHDKFTRQDEHIGLGHMAMASDGLIFWEAEDSVYDLAVLIVIQHVNFESFNAGHGIECEGIIDVHGGLSVFATSINQSEAGL